MALLKEEEFEGFLKQRLSAFSGLLIHGDDEAVISSMAAQSISRLIKESATPLLVEELDSASCRKSPGLFSDALNAMSLLGDKSLLVLESVDDSCLSFLAPLFEHRPGGNFVVLKAHALKKDSSLRVAVETNKYCAAVAVFPDDERTAAARARSFLKDKDLSWGEGAEQSFFDLVGFDRPIVMQELGKLALYCFGSKIVTLEDVNSICGDLAEGSMDDLIDAMLAGDVLGVDQGLEGAVAKDNKSVLPLLSLHLSRLAAFSSAMAEGQNADAVIRAARPPVFFKRRSAIINQLNRLSLLQLVELQTAVQALVLKARQLGSISDAAISRALLSMTRNLKSRSR
jgi:DNA polymerase-3 subunit delta